MRSLENRVRGLDELPYLKDDLKYHLHKYRKEQTRDGDADALLASLQGRKEVNSTYFLRMRMVGWRTYSGVIKNRT